MPRSVENLIIGIHAVSAAVTSAPENVQRIIVAAEASNRRVQEVMREARNKGVSIETAPREWLDRQCPGQRHQDLVADFKPANLYGESDLERLLETVKNDSADGDPFILVLDGLQDPHNLGACIRSAAAGGVHFAVITTDRSVSLTPVARRAASGAAESLPLVFVTNLARTLRQLKDHGIWLTGTSEHAERSLYGHDLTGPLAMVMGGEGKGMRRLTADLCDHLVRIPMPGEPGSLNVSVATAVCLFEAVRQRTLA